MQRSNSVLRQAFICPSSNSSTSNCVHYFSNLRPASSLLINRQYATKKNQQQHDITASTASIYNPILKPFNTATDDPFNGPLSTLPAPLELPTRDPNEPAYKFYFHTGKAYGKFYWAGVQNAALNNVKLAAPVLKRFNQDGGIEKAKQMRWLTRSDFQLIRRRNHDLKRIPIFALVVAVCGEFTPLVVIMLSSLVPYTCRIPQQIEKDRQKLEARRSEALKSFSPKLDATALSRTAETLSPAEVLYCSTILGLHSDLSHKLFLSPIWAIRRRLQRQAQYLDIDDAFLSKSETVAKLSEPEVDIACIDRGVRTQGKSTENQRESLAWWIEQRFSGSGKSCYDIWLTNRL